VDQQTFTNINKILVRDSKSTTYKFALLRGTIDLIGDNSPYIIIKEERAHFPLGLLIEKWLLYYYPLVDIPQINGQTNLAFGTKLKEIAAYYKNCGGFSAFYNDLKNKRIPLEINILFLELVKQLAKTITEMPMRYIGNSIYNQDYSIFQHERIIIRKKTERIGIEFLIHHFGTFSIPLAYYKAFQVLGSFIGGQDSILFKWAEFSVQASGKALSVNQVLHEVLKSPVTTRDIIESKALYQAILQKEGKVYCVWSGKKVARYDIDHIIPFTVWKNNDLWNLLPVQPVLNNQKRDKIPSVALIENQQGLIMHYWDIISQAKQQRFQKEMQVALLGYETSENWQTQGITQLKNSCDYLITTRGFEGRNGLL
jgi:hypothetical protein